MGPQYDHFCWTRLKLTIKFLSLFNFWNCDTSSSHLFCFSMRFVSSVNLPSYFRGDPGNQRDRLTSLGWDVFICWILNKRSNQIKVLLYQASRNSSASSVNQTSDVTAVFHDVVMGNHANTITSLNGSETNGYNATLNFIERKVS